LKEASGFHMNKVRSMKYFRHSAAALAFCTTLALSPAIASSFWPGVVSNVPSGQTLAIRQTPSPMGLQLGSANNGDDVSLTGRCRKLKPNGSTLNNFRIDVPGTIAWRKAKMSQGRTWCELWFEVAPSDYKAVWARGSYIMPG
jgi:hypothetical protein